MSPTISTLSDASAASSPSSLFPVPSPYAHLVADRDPVALMGETPHEIETLVTGWSDDDFERTYGPGKWSARELLVHLAHVELVSGNRVRLAITTPQYVVQSWHVDPWMAADSRATARVALEAYLSLRRFNLMLYRALVREQIDRQFSHPELLAISVGWILTTIAGHDVHHLRHLEIIARA